MIKSINELHKFVLLEGGGIQRAYYDEGCHHLRRFEYLKGEGLCLCYDAYGDGMILSMAEKVVDTADTEEELERRKKEL